MFIMQCHFLPAARCVIASIGVVFAFAATSATIATANDRTEHSILEAMIDSLTVERSQLQNDAAGLQARIVRLTLVVDSLRSRLLALPSPDDSLPPVSARTQRKTKVVPRADLTSPEITYLQQGTDVTVYEWYGGLFRISFGESGGWISGLDLEDSQQLTALRHAGYPKYQADQAALKRKQAALKRQEAKERDARASKQRAELAAKWGADLGGRIDRHEIWIGMSSAMALASIGSPRERNRTVTASGVREQWVYAERYLYFDDGILTGWQD
ncbi:MAG: hypothetical protein ACYDIE_10125 [Candidatus Krumholzibacteriia bacterium]